ncbi:MAG: hypothetical protein WCK73_00865 [Deltaproteobacteria bacterium]
MNRGFPARFPELPLPRSISDWSDDHRLLALAARGEDCVGNLVVGDDSLRRLSLRDPVEVGPGDFPAIAEGAAADAVGSSAGGERPKFGAFVAGRDGTLRIAPAYDMLPMILAPVGDIVTFHPFAPEPPSGESIDVWSDAAGWAERYWGELCANRELGSDLAALAERAGGAVAELRRRVG